MRSKLIQMTALAGLALASPIVIAADTGSTSPHHMAWHDRGWPRASIERAATDNLLAANLAQSTGRDVSEISQLLESSPPHEVASQLGLSRDAMMKAMQAAHASLIQKALAAGLITETQAEKLSSMPAPPPPPPQQ